MKKLNVEWRSLITKRGQSHFLFIQLILIEPQLNSRYSPEK